MIFVVGLACGAALTWAADRYIKEPDDPALICAVWIACPVAVISALVYWWLA